MPASPRPGAAADPFHLLAADRTSGAYPLAEAALAALARALPKGRIDRPTVRRWALQLRRAQPAMGAILRLSEELGRFARSANSSLSAPRLLRWAKLRRRELHREERRVVSRARRALPPQVRIVTLSASSMVARLLASTPRSQRPTSVVVLRSLPGGEGVRFAAALRAQGLEARVVPDSRGPEEVRRADLLLVGADTVYGDGSLLHKVGTRALAAAARRAGCPVVSVTGTSKMIRGRPPRPVPGAGHFDRTPGSDISAYWTELGPVAPEELPLRFSGKARRTRSAPSGPPAGSDGG
jgi:translation initiation factor eIF-2B subunit delta